MKHGYLIKATWQWAAFSTFHTVYYFAWTVPELLERLKKIRNATYWKEEPVRIGEGTTGTAILFVSYYVHEVEL